MRHEDVPRAFGTVLTGTNYGIKQTRGKFGLGSKMVLIWSKMTTGQPVQIRTARKASDQLTMCRLDIDLQANRPDVKVRGVSDFVG